MHETKEKNYEKLKNDNFVSLFIALVSQALANHIFAL